MVKPLAEFPKHNRYANRLATRCKECRRAYERKRYATVPAVRAREAKRRRKLAADPAYRAKVNERQRERYANDPAYRAMQSERHKKLWATDPAYRARAFRAKAASRAKAKKKGGNPP